MHQAPWDLRRPATAPSMPLGTSRRHVSPTRDRVSSVLCIPVSSRGSTSQKSPSCLFLFDQRPRDSLCARCPRKHFVVPDASHPRHEPGRPCRPGGCRGSIRRHLLSPSVASVGTECWASRRMTLSPPDTQLRVRARGRRGSVSRLQTHDGLPHAWRLRTRARLLSPRSGGLQSRVRLAELEARRGRATLPRGPEGGACLAPPSFWRPRQSPCHLRSALSSARIRPGSASHKRRDDIWDPSG